MVALGWIQPPPVVSKRAIESFGGEVTENSDSATRRIAAKHGIQGGIYHVPEGAGCTLQKVDMVRNRAHD